MIKHQKPQPERYSLSLLCLLNHQGIIQHSIRDCAGIRNQSNDGRPSKSESTEVKALVEVMRALVDGFEDLGVACGDAWWDFPLIICRCIGGW